MQETPTVRIPAGLRRDLDRLRRARVVPASDRAREALRGKIRLAPAAIAEIRGFLQAHGTLLEPAPVETDASRHPGDRRVLGLAVAAGADVVVTGDQDLLVLKSFQDIPIVSPRDFWARWGR